jgi:hypothetical protein
MFSSNYFPYSTPTYSYGGRPDSDYLQALAEEEAARRQYADALRAQDEARNRAARARLARQAYELSHNSYLSDDDDDAYGGYASPGFGYGHPSRRRPSYGYPTNLERQRLAALERERERERLRFMEEERERRRQMMEIEEERRRRRVLEEEERRIQLQREAEERERMRLEQELLRRQQQSRQQQSRQQPAMSPLEELFGLRPPRMAQSKSQESVCTISPRTSSYVELIDLHYPALCTSRTNHVTGNACPSYTTARRETNLSLTTSRACSHSYPRLTDCDAEASTARPIAQTSSSSATDRARD